MASKKTQLKKSDILYHLLKGWRVILLFSLMGLIAGITLIGFGYVRGEMVKEYRINASVVVVALNAEGEYSTHVGNPLRTDVDFARDLAQDALYIIRSRSNLQNVCDQLNLRGVSSGTIAANLQLSQYNSTEFIEMSLLWRSEREGKEIMEKIIDCSDKAMLDALKIGRITTINKPAASFSFVANIGISTWLYAAIIGFAIGVLFCLLRFIFSATVINGSDLEEVFGLDLLAVMPFDKKYSRYKGSVNADVPIRDDMKSLAHMLINRMGLANARRIYITSAKHAEGRTGIIANIAYHISELGKKTLLVDCDIKNPQLGTLFKDDLLYEQTLNALYRGDSDKVDAVLHINGCLDLLPVILEKVPDNFNDAMLAAIESVMDDYDYVLIDAAPIGVDAETLRLNEITDAALFVVRSDYASVDSIKKSIHRLDKSGISIIGGIFNAASTWRDAFKRTKKRMDDFDAALSARTSLREKKEKKEKNSKDKKSKK